ncbi:PilX N-terminal domain-containing pilus assembly protein [Xanthomonadaceae bacterium XH05]|nr:PilX N-terminal domain-containing pilus assembly protein [Xanthomonadaceae bacterium XH05]
MRSAIEYVIEPLVDRIEADMTPDRTISVPKRQQGAVFFVSMMLLIILSLLAISAAQVTGLQERMANIYRADVVAFENAESMLRETERDLLDDPNLCFLADADPVMTWQQNPTSVNAASTVSNMAVGERARSFGWRGTSRAGVARTGGDLQCSYFHISAIDHDDDANRTSSAIIQSVFVP